MRFVGLPFAIVAAAALAACGGPAPGARKLAPVAALPQPSLPAWIASISPTGKAENLAQIRVIFAKPVAPVTALSGPGPREVLSHVSIEPDLAGHFTLLTPRMIGFIADQALPLGTRVSVRLGAGLRDLAGDTLSHDLAWTFQTPPLEFTDVPQIAAAGDESTPPPVGLNPTLKVTANAATDTSSLAARAALIGGSERVGLTATLETQPTPYPETKAQELFDPSLKTWIYRLRPTRELRRGTTYVLEIPPGIAPLYGNLLTTKRFDGMIRTYDALTIVPTPRPSPNGGGRFAGGDPAIAFTNPLDPKSVAGAITISPAPASVKTLVTVPDQSNLIAIDPYALDPDSTYTATIAATVKDVFGQTLGQTQKVTIRTSDFASGAWAPTGTSLIPAGAPIALNFYATNLPGNAYHAAYATVSPLKLLGNPEALAMLPATNQWPARALGGARRNVQSIVRVPLREQLGGAYGALAYGFRTGLDAPNSSPGLTGIAQLTNLGVFAQWFPSHGIVLVQHLNDGAPVSGASVAVYRIDENNKVRPAQCATGTTSSAGELDLTGVDVERCSIGAAATQNQAPNLGVVVTQGHDVATLTIWNYSGITRFDVSGGWISGAPLSRGTIFTDRQMYQPGERGQLTGIAYYVKGARIVADANAIYRVKLVDPNNNESPLGQVRTDALGVFSTPIAFSKEQALGYYTVDAKGTNGNEISGSLRVAEFKPPNFRLTLTLGAKSATAGSSVHASVAAAYLFGAPLQGGTAHAYVTRDLATLQPKGWDDFSFGPQWFWPEQTPSFDTDVLQRDLALDKTGNAALDVAVPRDLPFPMTYRVDMETTDVSNLSVADSQSFFALPSDAIIGLASDTVGSTGKPMTIRAIVTDTDGKPIAGRSVHLELQKMTFTSATQETEGGESAQQSIKYDTVATADVTSGNQPVTAALTPSDVGPYRVRASFDSAQDDKIGGGNASATDIQVFAFGPGEADWGLEDSNAVAVKLDKKQYAIGDTASALVGSPYDRADIYLAVVRGNAIYRTTLRDVHGAVHANFKITPEMLPNAALEAIVVRRRSAGERGGPDTLMLTGMAGFTVDVASRNLKLGIAARNATVTPGGEQHVDFSVKAQTGTPVRGEVVAMVVNDAILQLSGYRLPDLVQTIFAAQPIATIFADNRENVMLKTQKAPLEKGFGYGGGYLAGAASTRVRVNFRPLAYYGLLKTDSAGRASANFTMPDDLTTWRVMAVALAQDAAHFGTADSSFISSQPLIANPLLPQFARSGDRFDLGLSIANQTAAAGALDLVLKLTGALAFAQGDPQTQRATENAATGMQAFRFPVNVGTPTPTSVAANAALGGHRDAFSVPFVSSDRGTTDSVIESGATRGQASIPIALGSGGSLQITLANSVVPQFVVPSERAMLGEALPLLDDASSRLVIASALARLREPYHLALKFDPAAAIATNLQQLLALQRSDGGFGWFANAPESDPFTTAAALGSLIFARDRGVAINSSAVARAADFMAQVLANPGRFKWCASDALCKARLRFEALWALAAAGRPRTDFLPEIVAQFDRFDSATQIRLARYLLRTSGWQAQGAAFADRLQQTFYVTGRYVVANPSTRWRFIGSLTDAQAQMLQLLLERHAPAEQLDGAVRALVAQQCKCGWPTIDDAASALVALSGYAATERLAPATAIALVGNKNIGAARFGSTASSKTFTVPAASLHGNALTVKTNSGTVHYTLLYTYPVPNDSPGELAAFRVMRLLNNPAGASSTGGAGALATMDLAPARPVEIAAGRVFDVGVRTIVDHPVDRLVIEDPMPAGFEAVDTTFRTALQAVVPQANSWQIDTSQIYRDRVVAYAQHLDPGVYELHYLVRSVTPGTFAWPGSRAYLRDAPEQFGRAAAATLRVTQ